MHTMPEYEYRPSDNAVERASFVTPADYTSVPELKVSKTLPRATVTDRPQAVLIPPPSDRTAVRDAPPVNEYAYDFASPPDGVKAEPQFKSVWNQEDVDPEAVERAVKARYQQGRHPLPGEAAKTPEELAVRQRFSRALVAIGDDAGIDLRKRIAQPSRHHVFSSPDGFQEAYERTTRRPLPEGGQRKLPSGFFVDKLGSLVMRNADNPVHASNVAGHEDVHGLAFRYVGVSAPKDGSNGSGGLDEARIVNGSPFISLPNAAGIAPVDEAIAEMITHQAKLRAGDDVPREMNRYGPFNILLGGMIKAAAKYHGESPAGMEKYVTQGALAGKYGINLFYPAMHKEGVDRFEQITTYDANEVHNINSIIGFPPAIAREVSLKLYDYEQYRPVEAFDWHE
jgi:hypothetical protein